VKTCEFCGEALEVELLDWWAGPREFTLSTCCEERYWVAREDLEAAIAEGPQSEAGRAFRKWWEEQTGRPLRQVFSDWGQALLDYGLEVRPVDLKTAKEFIRRHHRHNPPPVSWRWGHAVYNGADLVAVAMVGRPVARRIDHTRVVEVTRLCVNPELAQAVAWNACSMLYGAAAREAKRRGFGQVVTYTLESERGTALKAVGWKVAGLTKGGTWNRPSRKRIDKAPTCRKVRWERRIA